MSRLPTLIRPALIRLCGVRTMSGGSLGDGEGKGGGTGGSVRSAGGSFGKMEAAHEEQFFREQQKEQLKVLKHMMEDEVSHHESQIRMHQEAIDHHRKRMKRLEKKSDSSSDSD